jgi:hypothetical protein
MTAPELIQGRVVTQTDVEAIRALIASHPEWSRRRVSEAVATAWAWRTPTGQLKDMAARTLLLKLDARGVVALPPRRRRPSNRMAPRAITAGPPPLPVVTGRLGEVGPLVLEEMSRDQAARREWAAALATWHYLGYRGTVGENLQYTVRDRDGRLLACLLFGSAAWTCRPRDTFIGWSRDQRAARLSWLTNNTRFLILPSVHVAHLASWILGGVLRRLSQDWQRKYGHAIALVETFVERDRFAGTSYRAANWQCVGPTTGRSRQDRYTTLRVPVKDIYVYPLRPDFREVLTA